jgi:Fe-S cluster assembly iron-binding protein IscA
LHLPEAFTLNITSQAAQAINSLTAGHPGAGLRISCRVDKPDGGEVDLALSVVNSPADTDATVEDNRAQVFLEDRVAPLLEDKTLDVTTKEDTKEVLFQLVRGQS